jgi:hypothetical protein
MNLTGRQKGSIMHNVKVDKFGDQSFTEMYNNYAIMDLETYRKWCITAIGERMVSSKEKKMNFIRGIQGCRTKDQMVTKLTNMALAGESLGVSNSKQYA